MLLEAREQIPSSSHNILQSQSQNTFCACALIVFFNYYYCFCFLIVIFFIFNFACQIKIILVKFIELELLMIVLHQRCRRNDKRRGKERKKQGRNHSQGWRAVAPANFFKTPYKIGLAPKIKNSCICLLTKNSEFCPWKEKRKRQVKRHFYPYF